MAAQTFAACAVLVDAVAASSSVEIFVSLVASDKTFRHPVSRRWCFGWRCAADCCAVRARRTGEVILLGGDVAGVTSVECWSQCRDLTCGDLF